jgi:hypothetical protein
VQRAAVFIGVSRTGGLPALNAVTFSSITTLAAGGGR